ncbi:PEP-CTERM sorting domain-containing protein [Thalassotalea piscium]
MKNSKMTKFIATLALCLFANVSQATLITEITHDFGTDVGKILPAGGVDGSSGCNTISADWITVTDKKDCNRFYDYFDLSNVDYDSIDSFTLSLTFSDTNRGSWFPLEDWRVMAASSGSNADKDNMQDIDRVSGMSSQDFIFNGSNTKASVFNDILVRKQFAFWLGDEAWFSNSFNLSSATLKIEGTPALTSTTVPEPNMIALFALGLFFMSRTKSKK